jgi:CRISPR-associated endoribonuclease Cas6
MRINLQTTPSTKEIGFGYKHLVNGFVHKQISPEHSGINDLHDALSLYSVSNLDGGHRNSTGSLAFPKGASFFVSCYDTALAKLFVQNIMTQPELFAGMSISDISIQNTPDFPDSMRFSVASPVLVKKFDGTSIRHLTFNDPEANDVMTKTLQTKLRAAGLDAHAETVRIRFDTSYASAKTKLVDIHGIKNRANMCPVIIEGTPEAVAFAWDVGVGHSTGAGFGALR